jgi:hypothetical protein
LEGGGNYCVYTYNGAYNSHWIFHFLSEAKKKKTKRYLNQVITCTLIKLVNLHPNSKVLKLLFLADMERSHLTLLKESASPIGFTTTEEGQLVSSEDLPFMDLNTIRAATDNFSDSNKLGQGGFGTVYKVSGQGALLS